MMDDNAKIIVLGYYSPSRHEATRVVSGGGIYPTVKENHQTVPAVVVEVKDERGHSSNYRR